MRPPHRRWRSAVAPRVPLARTSGIDRMEVRMDRVLASQLHGCIGERVRMAGWLHHQRQLAQVTFLLLRDRSGVPQVVVESASDRSVIGAFFPETVLELEGNVVRNEQAPAGVEIVDARILVVAEPQGAPPLELRRPKLNARLPPLLDHAAVSLRHPARRA